MNNCVKQADITKLKVMVCPWIADKFDGVRVFTSGLDSGHMGFGVAIIMDSSLVKHVCKISEVPGQLLSIRLLFENKLFVSILGLYAGASLVVQFSQASDINFLVAKAVNETSFVILSGDFNEDGSHKCASFRKCFDLGLCNFCGVAKTIDYMLVSSSLVNTIMDHSVVGVEDFFDTDHRAVSVSVGLGVLLDVQLLSLYKQANKNCWKFDVKNTSGGKWLEFKNATAANASMLSDAFDAMWDVVCKILILSAGETFKKKWFKGYSSVFNKVSSKFYRLKLLVSKLVKASCLVFGGNFASLLDTWDRLDSIGALSIKSLFLLGSGFDAICSELAKARKVYYSLKMMESKRTEESRIRQAIEKRMESFEVDKGRTIRSVLEHPFHKMVLDHLVTGKELVLEPDLVKSKVDEIMEGWTRKHVVMLNISDTWVRQFQPLDYVFNDAFSEVMCSIGFNELLTIVSNLPDGKAVGLFGIFNELWKHYDRKVLNMLLLLLNFCLVHKSVLGSWKEAWVSMILKPYEWEGILTNTHPIVLIEMACKILSKILSDRIFSACSRFNVLCRDNAIAHFCHWFCGERCIKKEPRTVAGFMCDKFIRFFGDIHNGRINRVMMDFGLTNGYRVHDSLDQREVFLLLLWCIFYDLLLCEVKQQESMCGYRLNSHFISRIGQVEPQARLMSFFVAGAFVDNTIWVGGSRAATQHILNVAGEFFRINDILINNDKTVAIPINSQIANLSLTINDSSISIAKKSLLMPSLAKACSDVWFFVNFVLKKTILDKQFAYLVSVVLLSIISYRTQFSFVSVGVYNKWDSMVRRCLKSKSGLPLDFPNDAVYYPSLYNFKTFEQIQAESKSAAVLAFANSVGILGHLFSHRSHDLQALTHVYVSPSNNFLSGVVRIFSGCDLSLGASLASTFRLRNGTPMSLVLGEPRFLKCVLSLKHYSIAFVEQLRNRHGIAFIPVWFDISVWFLGSVVPFSGCSLLISDHASPDICLSRNFGMVCNNLLDIDTAVRLSVYTDGSLSGLGTVGMKAGAALGVKVSGLVSSTLTELQVIALALECVPFFHLVDLFSDSQAALDVCKSKSLLARPDFRNCCWIECRHIANIIYDKNLDVNWIKVKSHSSVPNNDYADSLAGVSASSSWWLLHRIGERFLRAGDSAISGNSRYFEVGSSSQVLVDSLRSDVDWTRSVSVWHLDSHMAAGFTNLHTAGFQTYFMKALHHQLPVTMRKHLYDRLYPSVVCLFYGDVEISNHVFSCSFDAVGCKHLMNTYAAVWEAHSHLSRSSLCISQLLSTCASNCVVGVALCKEFVFNNWYCESVSVFKNPRVAACNMVFFVCEFCAAFWDEIWLVCVRHWAVIEKDGLIPCDGSIFASVFGFSMGFSAGVVRLLGIADAIGICFRFRRSCLFFSGVCEEVSVHISV
ncbi:hypothetical protein G9A89_021035 [Geosiphon pyriformis]|nr:hypothetical protein G9A89_021035 [Geosiphon pyriformis]